MAKHSSSPWWLDTKEGYPHLIRSDDGGIICRVGGHASAIASEEENDANEALIIAAPEMAEWLMDEFERLDKIEPIDMGKRQLQRFARLAQIVKKIQPS